MFGYDDIANHIALGKQALSLCCEWVLSRYEARPVDSSNEPLFGFLLEMAIEERRFPCKYGDYLQALGFVKQKGAWFFKFEESTSSTK